jgi:5'-nucleotidase
MDGAVDVIVAGHTHSRLELNLDGKLTVNAFSYGTAFDRVRMTVDRSTRDVVRAAGEVIRTPHEGIMPDPEIDALVSDYDQQMAPLAERVVGSAPRYLDNDSVDRLAVKAQRAYADADIAFLNPGNTRSDLKAGPVTYADASQVQAYEHPVTRMETRGSDLLTVMAEQPGLLVSGSPDLDRDTGYTVAANGNVAGRPPFDRAPGREVVGTDLEALVAWLERNPR